MNRSNQKGLANEYKALVNSMPVGSLVQPTYGRRGWIGTILEWTWKEHTFFGAHSAWYATAKVSVTHDVWGNELPKESYRVGGARRIVFLPPHLLKPSEKVLKV